MYLNTFLTVTSILLASLLVWISIWMTQYQIYVSKGQSTFTVTQGFLVILIAILGLIASIVMAVFGAFAAQPAVAPYAIALFGFSVSVAVMFAFAAAISVFSKLGGDPFATPLRGSDSLDRPTARMFIFLSTGVAALLILVLWLVLVPTFTDWTLYPEVPPY